MKDGAGVAGKGNMNPDSRKIIPDREARIHQVLLKKAAHENIPMSGTFELTPLCNLNCRMCYIRMSRQEMDARGRQVSAGEWISLGRECVKGGLLFLLLTGGEPFLRPDFKEIYSGLKKEGLVLSINTNGTMITDDIVDFLKADPPLRVNVTLYGSNNRIYEELCGARNGFDAALEGILKLKEAGIYVKINASFTKQNVDDMEEIFSFARENDLLVTPAWYMFPPLRNSKDGVCDGECRLSAAEGGRAKFLCEKLLNGEDFMRKQAASAKENGVVSCGQDEYECGRIPDEKMGCLAGRGSFWVSWDGKMTPCGMMSVPETHPFEEGFMPAFRKLNRGINDFFLPAECRDCKKRQICNVCGALAMAEGGGDMTKRPQYLCEAADEYLRLLKGYEDR